ncbi:hypothetical protein KI387_044257 [Taxus chinensis]|uniref:Uncharacterized protein n=1 Tax=Taxus chinensis TaxID=29808 RepID=A0AA38CGM4_TAXCH|nr:hypothetical protein KI387_044257 [Taxus chinensis]
MIGIGVVGIDKDVGTFGICGDVSDVITDGVDLMGKGNVANAGAFSDVEVEGTGCFINVSRGKNDMLANGVDVEGRVVRVHVVELSLVGMVVRKVGVVTSVFDADMGEEIDGRDVRICVDTSGAEISAKDESNVIDWGVFEAVEMDDIVEFDVDVIRIGEGVGSG